MDSFLTDYRYSDHFFTGINDILTQPAVGICDPDWYINDQVYLYRWIFVYYIYTRVGRFLCFSVFNLYFRLEKLWTTILSPLQEEKKKISLGLSSRGYFGQKNPTLVKSKK